MPLMGYRRNEGIAAQHKLVQFRSLGSGTAWAFNNIFLEDCLPMESCLFCYETLNFKEDSVPRHKLFNRYLNRQSRVLLHHFLRGRYMFFILTIST